MKQLLLCVSLICLFLCINFTKSQATDIVFSSYDIQEVTKEEIILHNFNLWYGQFLQDIALFEGQHQTDFLDNAHLQKILKDFGSSYMEGISPPSCQLHLANNVIDSIASKPLFFQVHELVPIIRSELEQLKIKLLVLLEKGVPLKYNSDWDFFAMTQSKSYFKYIQIALEKNRFKEYKEVIKDWVIAVDTSVNNLIFDEENEKYEYKSKLIALNLSKLLRVENDLIDFSDFINPIIKELRVRDTSMKISEINDLFSTQTRKAPTSIYTKLTGLYNTAMEKGSFEHNFDLIEITLPKMSQIKQAILRAKE